ncbi:MAG: hypothetical protein SPI65_03350 [Peptoniphilus sp.]|nr:hypothetical protein [Peptoniphilus sp.]MDD7362708.1 hypothetical protein [Bacillota bacterium]MDY6044598.1 hypothetical protein [Peptoniphilus sp.]
MMLLTAVPIKSFAAINPPNWNEKSEDIAGKQNVWRLGTNQKLATQPGADAALPMLEMVYQGQEGEFAHFRTRLSGTSNTANGYNLLLRADERLGNRVDMKGSYFERNGRRYNLTQEAVDENLIGRANLSAIFRDGYNANKPPMADFYLKVGSEDVSGDYVLQGRFYKGSVGSEQILNYTALAAQHSAFLNKDPYKYYTQTYSMSNTYRDANMALGVEKKDIPWTDGTDQIDGINSYFQIDNETNKLRVFYVWRGIQGGNGDFSSNTFVDSDQVKHNYNIGFRITFPNEFYDVLKPVDGKALVYSGNGGDVRDASYYGRYTQIGQAGHKFVDGSYAEISKGSLDTEQALRGLVALEGIRDFKGGYSNYGGISKDTYPEGAFNQRILTTDKLSRGNGGNGFTSIDVVGPKFSEGAVTNFYKANYDKRHIGLASRAGAPVANMFEFNIDPVKFREKFYDEDGNYNGKLVFRNSFIFNEKGTNKIIELDKSASYASGTGEATQYTPKVEDVFTGEDAPFTGYTRYPLGKVYYFTKDGDKTVLGSADTSNAPKELSLRNTGDSGYAQYDGYKFSIKRPDVQIIKDMPIEFMAEEPTKIPSKAVTEQVQSKVHFDLNGQIAKIGKGTRVIDKIAPLNKEYSYERKADENGNTVFEKNENYRYSGFAKIDDQGKVVGAENVRVDDKNKTIVVKQKLRDLNGDVTEIERTVINYENHENRPYDVHATNEDIKDSEIEDLLRRQFPVDEEVNLPNSKRIIGWTTVKLEDDAYGKTAEEKFYDLQNEKNKVVRKAGDWIKAEKEAYIFDELSPVDRDRTVYAVYGGLNLVLHSGNYDSDGNEEIVRLPITKYDIDTIEQKLLGMTAEDIESLKNTTIVKEIPRAPYTSNKEDVAAADPLLRKFVKDGQSFVGWTTLKNQKTIKVGANNERISQLMEGEVTLKDGTTMKIPKNTENLEYMKGHSETALLPNGFNFYFEANQFEANGKELTSVDDMLKNIKEINLYAIYRPFFDITVSPQYRLADKTNLDPQNNKFGEYVDGVDAAKQRPLQIGLLTRSAVSSYRTPTINAAASYDPLAREGSLKMWTPGGEDLQWKEPGFDVLGRRKSFIAAVVKEGNEDAYVNFANPFSETSWNKLNISIHEKGAGDVTTLNVARNLYRGEGENWDPYGKPLGKVQSVTFKEGETIDAFTSATSKQPMLNGNEVTGYDIVMTLSPESVLTPKFDKIKNTDKEIKLEWENNADYQSIDKIEFYIGGKIYTMTRQADGSFVSQDGRVTASVSESRLIVTGIDISDESGSLIESRYFKTVEGDELQSQKASMTILSDKTSEAVHIMRQGVKENPEDQVKIEFMVPVKTLDNVGIGSKYVAEKWNGESWVRVGEKTLTMEDGLYGTFEGNFYDIKLDKVDDGDIIRIISEESNPNAETGYSHPAYSTGDKDLAPTESVENQNVQYVKLDLKAPEGEIKAEDELFRRFVNLRGELDEIPSGREVVLEINTSGKNQGDRFNVTQRFDTKENLVEYLYGIPRFEEMPQMWILAKDYFGNERVIPINYEKTYQITVSASDYRARRKTINVTSDMAGAKVTATVYRNGTEQVAGGVATVEAAGKYSALNIETSEGSPYRLKKGDRVHITGELEQDGKSYTSNPFDIFVR